MKTIPTKQIHRCEHCKKIYLDPRYCLEHEDKCLLNPENKRVCHWCNHCEKVEVEYFYDTFNGESSRMVNAFICHKHDMYIYPFKVEISEQGEYDFGDKPNEPMRKECAEFN